MKKTLNNIILSAILLFLFMPSIGLAQEDVFRDTVFKAKVVRIIEEITVDMPDGEKSKQQNLKLLGLEGDYKDKEVDFIGIGDLDVLSKQIYDVGEKVIVAASPGTEGINFYIVDSVRTGKLWLLSIIFLFSLLLVGGVKGLRSLVSLVLTFTVIIKYIIPEILAGSSPLLVTVAGSLVVLLIIIYVTEGINARANLSVISIFISLVLTVLLAHAFVVASKLTGAASEDILFLFNIEGVSINLQGLLLAGIIIGTLGVLDDVVISQIATVEQIHETNKDLTARQIFKKAYSVGVSHISSMTNTLFLAYAGVSLPLLILFVSGESAFSGWQQAINTELISTEIIRTLSGSIGLILSVPIATYIGSWWYGKKIKHL